MLKEILDEYDEIKTTSNWEIIDKEYDESPNIIQLTLTMNFRYYNLN